MGKLMHLNFLPLTVRFGCFAIKNKQLGMVAYNFNPSIQEAKAGEPLPVQGQPGLDRVRGHPDLHGETQSWEPPTNKIIHTYNNILNGASLTCFSLSWVCALLFT